jgi:hypothetical protein
MSASYASHVTVPAPTLARAHGGGAAAALARRFWRPPLGMCWLSDSVIKSCPISLHDLLVPLHVLPPPQC